MKGNAEKDVTPFATQSPLFPISHPSNIFFVSCECVAGGANPGSGGDGDPARARRSPAAPCGVSDEGTRLPRPGIMTFSKYPTPPTLSPRPPPSLFRVERSNPLRAKRFSAWCSLRPRVEIVYLSAPLPFGHLPSHHFLVSGAGRLLTPCFRAEVAFRRRMRQFFFRKVHAFHSCHVVLSPSGFAPRVVHERARLCPRSVCRLRRRRICTWNVVLYHCE